MVALDLYVPPFSHLCMYIVSQVAPELSKDIGREPVCLNRLEPLLALFITLSRDLTVYLFTHGSDPKSHWFTSADEYPGPLSEERRDLLSIDIDAVP